MIRGVVALAGVFAALVGCSSPEEPPSPPPTTSAPEDSGLRTVALPFGDGLPYVAAETSAQGICQAHTPEVWRELLGGPVGRTIDDGTTCVVASTDVTVRLRMRELVLDPDVETATIAGHRVRFWDGEAATALLPVGEQDQEAQLLSGTLPVFHAEGPDETLRELFAALLPVLVHDGPPVPVSDAGGEVPYTPTAPLPGVRLVDLPAPVQGLVLCTAVVAVTGAPADRVHIGRKGLCEVADTLVIVFAEYGMGEPTRTVAGKPATVDEDEVFVALNLPDRGVLSIQRDVADLAFAEQLVGTLGDL